MSSELEAEIQKKIHDLPEAKQQRLLAVIKEFLRQPETPQRSGERPIWAIFEELSRQVSPKEWQKLPPDGAEQHDHYLYGTPKRNNP
jgi:hypothetical protein